MYKKTKVREILYLLSREISASEIAETLHVSRNTVAYIKNTYDDNEMDIEELYLLDDDQMYAIFYPTKFAPRNRFVPVDYGYVHKELKRIGVNETLLWEEYRDKCISAGVKYCCFATFASGYKRYLSEKNYTSHIEHKPGVSLEVDWSGPTMSYYDRDSNSNISAYLFVATFPYSQYTYVEACNSMDESNWLSCHVNMFNFFGGTPVKIVSDNLKTGVISHPKHGEIVLNEAYLSLAEYYQVAIIPAGVKKPKQKASVEGSVGKIARKIIGMLRNETYYSLSGLNEGIHNALEKLNHKSFKKREGNRKLIFDNEELPMLKKLPLLPYEVCSWTYGLLVYPDSHISFDNGRYSVPHQLIGKKVDVKYNNSIVHIYHSHKSVAVHSRLLPGSKNGSRTIEKHLPQPLYTLPTVDSIIEDSYEIGMYTARVIERLFNEAKVKEQAINDARAVLDIARLYNNDVLENACKEALKDFYKITYNTLIPYVKKENKNKNKPTEAKGLVRGSDYYRKDN